MSPVRAKELSFTSPSSLRHRPSPGASGTSPRADQGGPEQTPSSQSLWALPASQAPEAAPQHSLLAPPGHAAAPRQGPRAADNGKSTQTAAEQRPAGSQQRQNLQAEPKPSPVQPPSSQGCQRLRASLGLRLPSPRGAPSEEPALCGPEESARGGTSQATSAKRNTRN